METIKEAIEGLNPFEKNTHGHKVFQSEIINLLSLVAKDAFIQGRSIYIEKTPIPADKINITAEYQTFADYWKSFTDTLKTER